MAKFGNLKITYLLLLMVLGAGAQQSLSIESLKQQYLQCKDSGEKAELLITISELSYTANQQQSERYANRAYELSKEKSSVELKARALIQLINVSFQNSNNQRATVLTNELMKLLDKLPNHRYHSEAYRVAGRNYHLRGEYPLALSNYFKGLKYSEEEKDTVQMGEMYNILGGVYYNQHDVKNAYTYYYKGLQIQFKKNNFQRIGRGYLNIGSTYLLAKEFKKAKSALDSSLYYYSKANYEEGKLLVYTTLPEIYVSSGQVDTALKYYYLAYDFLKEHKRNFYIPQLDLQIAQLLVQRNKVEEALKRIQSGIDAGVLNRQNHDLAPLYLLKSEILDKAGRSKEAFESFKKYKLYSDSVINAASIKKQTEETLKYDYDKKELQQQLQIQEQDDRRRIIIIASVILLSILFFVFYYRYRIKQKANKLLERANTKLAEKNLLIEEKSKELQESLNERELLLKEIHHRVKNNLQVISGLLELQKEELTEDGSKAAFDEGQSRIRSISLIHQNLYQNEKLGSIQFKTFVEELWEQIKEVFEQNNREMKLEMQMPDTIFDIDTAVPLGLILNELLTNSYKYAASENKQGHVKLLLTGGDKGNFKLQFSDNGPGLKEGTDFGSANTLGLRLIKGLAGQLAGKAQYYYDNGAVFEIEFKDSKARLSE
ncbi:MAG: hypothetical protein IT236_17785 [Bacteroidia bacterium]|nr:hypothetical protein [Bacteroidia bacterium]